MSRSLLVMLDSRAPSPCHEFSPLQKQQESMSVATLHNVLLLAASYDSGELPMVVSVDSLDGVDSKVISTLQRCGCEWILRPEDTFRHESCVTLTQPQADIGLLGYYRFATMVVIDDKTRRVDIGFKTPEQYFLLHVSPENASNFASAFCDHLGATPAVTLRAQDLDLFEERDFLNYEQQLVFLGEHILNGVSRNGGERFSPNLTSNGAPGCGAGAALLTVGPDGLLYPCPAFYHAGKSHALTSVQELSSESGWEKRIQQLCSSLDCQACAFLSRMRNGMTDKALRFFQAEVQARRQLLHSAVRSPRLWRGLCSLETVASRVKTRLECEWAEAPVAQMHDVTMELLHHALLDIHTITLQGGAADNALSVSHNDICQYWQRLSGISSNSRRAAFQKRVLEIIAELLEIRHQRTNYAFYRYGELNNEKQVRSGDTVSTNVSFKLSHEELEDIRKLHTLQVGWNTLIESVRRDKAAGFVCDNMGWMESELSLVQDAVADWFQHARHRYGLKAEEGWNCEIDFAAQSLKASQVQLISDQSCLHDEEKYGPISEEQIQAVYLQDMDFQCSQSLSDAEGAIIDAFRCQYHDADAFHSMSGTATALLQELGDIKMAIDFWFSEMLVVYGLNQTVGYAVDAVEKKLNPIQRQKSMLCKRTKPFSTAAQAGCWSMEENILISGQ